MKFSLAEFWGVVTLITATFAALRFLYGNPAAIVGVILLSLPIRTIVCELVEQMGRASRRGNRIV